jgi:hypothetical protein
MAKWEICEIVQVGVKVPKLLGSKTLFGWEAQKMTPSGTREVIDKTEAVEVFQSWDQHQFLISRLASEGWEPTKHDEVGFVLSMKRRIEETTGRAATYASTDPADLLEQLANLRAAGVLTEQEFLAKKAQVLKRM